MKIAKVFPLESFTVYGNTGSLQKSGLHLYKFLVEYFCRWDKAHSLQRVYLQMFLKQRDRDNLLLRVADKISSIHVSTVDTNTTLAQRHTHTHTHTHTHHLHIDTHTHTHTICTKTDGQMDKQMDGTVYGDKFGGDQAKTIWL